MRTIKMGVLVLSIFLLFFSCGSGGDSGEESNPQSETTQDSTNELGWGEFKWDEGGWK